MTAGKAMALVVGLAGAFGLGVWTGPYVTERTAAAPDVAVVDAAAPRPGAARTASGWAGRAATIPPSSAELWKRLKPVLNEGTDREAAADGFESAEQFATVAHTARNTGVQFQVLKHRVLVEHKSLTAALKELNPSVDPMQAISRATAMARGDLAAIAG